MTFFDVVLAVCLMSDPASCHEQRLQYESLGSLKDCVFEAQFYIAQWQATDDNKKWVVKNWHCEYARDAQQSG